MSADHAVALADAPAYERIVDEILAGRRAPWPLPFLAEAGAPDLLATRIAQWRGEPPPDAPPAAGDVVACLPGTRAPAALFATLTGRRLVMLADATHLPAWLETLADADSLTLFLLCDDLDNVLLRAVAALSAQVSAGIVCTTTFAALTRVAAWQLLGAGVAPDPSHYLVFPESDLAEAFTGAATRSASGSGVEPQRFGRDAAPLGLFAFSGHGNPIDIHLGERHLLCGLRQGLRPAGVLAHPCLDGGPCTADPHARRERVAIDEVSATVVFADACGGISSGRGTRPAELSLAVGALESGVRAFISSVRTIESVDTAPALVSSALRSGIACGELAPLLAQLHRSAYHARPSHVVFGDPCVRLAPPAGAWRVERVEDAGDDVLEIRVSGRDRALVHVPLHANLQAGAAHWRDARIVACTASATDAQGRELPVGVHVDLLWPAPGEPVLSCCLADRPASFRVSIRIERCADRALAAAGEAVTRIGRNIQSTLLFQASLRCDGYAGTGPGPREFAADLDRLAVAGLAALQAMREVLGVARDRSSTTPGGRAWHLPALRDEFARLARLQRETLAGLPRWDMPPSLENVYLRDFAIDAQGDAGPCPTCGAPTEENELRHWIAGDVRRHSARCTRCFVIHDRAGGAPRVRMSVPTTPVRTHVDVRLELENAHAWPVDVECAFHATHGTAAGGLLPTPRALSTIRLDAFERRSLDVRIDVPPDVQVGMHKLVLLMLCELALSTANAVVLVGRPSVTRHPIALRRSPASTTPS